MSQELQEAGRLLQSAPAEAEAKLKVIVTKSPEDTNALYLLGLALRMQGKLDAAKLAFEQIIKRVPDFALAHHDLGITLLGAGQAEDGVKSLEQAVGLKPDLAQAWQALAEARQQTGDVSGASQAQREFQRLAGVGQAQQSDPQALQRVREHLNRGENTQAQSICQMLLQQNPQDAEAMSLLGAAANKLGEYQEAKAILERCLELTPDNHQARIILASVLFRIQEYDDSFHHLDTVELAKPNDPNVMLMRTRFIFELSNYEEAIKGYEDLIAQFKKVPLTMIEYGDALRVVGRTEDAIAAYREAESLAPGRGRPWHALANLKADALDESDIATLERHLDTPDISLEDEYLLAFALGTAQEDRGDWDAAAAAYERGNKAQRRCMPYDAEVTRQTLKSFEDIFTPSFVEAHKNIGASSNEPIFVVGLPRTGSTLIEQILATHSKVEGTFELPEMNYITSHLKGASSTVDASLYPDCLEDMPLTDFEAIGKHYLERTARRRSGGEFLSTRC